MPRPSPNRRRTAPGDFRDPRRNVRFVAGVLLVAVIIWRLFVAASWPGGEQGGGRPLPGEKARTAVVQRVVDGDTLLLMDGTRVRMIGIDTPETKKQDSPVEPFGPEASALTRAACEGREVRLVFDGDRVDRYGRVLAHVYSGERFLSDELIRAGLARVLYQFHYSSAMKDRFRAAENAAKREKKGIWSLPADSR